MYKYFAINIDFILCSILSYYMITLRCLAQRATSLSVRTVQNKVDYDYDDDDDDIITVKPVLSEPHIKWTHPLLGGHQLESLNFLPKFTVK